MRHGRQQTCWQILLAATHTSTRTPFHTHMQINICNKHINNCMYLVEVKFFASLYMVFLYFLQAIFPAKRCLICFGVFCALAISFALSSIWLIAFGMHRATQRRNRTHSKANKMQYATCHMPQYYR